MKRKEDKKQLRLLTRGDDLELSKFKKRTRIKVVTKNANQIGASTLFDNLISVEELAVIFGLAPQTIRNWVARGKIPYVKIGNRKWFLKGSMQEWLKQKEIPQWQ